MSLKNQTILSVILLLIFATILFNSQASAHFQHLSHYNGGGANLGKYYVNQALEPEYARPGEPANIEFSIQDADGNDISNVQIMVEIYQSSTGKRIELFPWKIYRTGDFEVPYIFNELGNYQVVVSLANENSVQSHSVDSRNILSSTLDCDCNRAVFNISISENFGTIWNSVMAITILLPITVFGFALLQNYLNKKKKGIQPSKQETVKYVIMLVALAGGIIHLVVYADHAGLRLEYSIFLLAAACAQIAFGSLYVIITMYESDSKSSQSIISHYHNTVLINTIGFIGTALLLGLYIYVIIFPPPLSPDNQPEEIEIQGILAKSVEFVLIVGIIYLMKYEKTKMKIQLDSIRT